MTQQAERLEYEKLRNPQLYGQAAPQQPDYAQQQNMRQLAMEKSMLEGQMEKMRNDMMQYMQSIQEGISAN